MRISVKLLASLLVIIALGGCARHTKPVQPITRQAPLRSEAAITSLRSTEGLVCFKCHNALTVDTGRKPTIAFSHEKHANRGTHCNQCHSDLGHGKNSQVHAPGIMPGHPQCFACHDGKKASNKCGYCHLQRGEPNPHPADWLGVHGMPALKNRASCLECHDDLSCVQCHTLTMPHPSNWVAVHGRQLSQGDCARCHPQQYCNQCHQRTRPSSHGTKGFTQTHGKLAVFGSDCSVCHSNQFCLNCHKLPMPHPGNWTSAHAAPGQTQTQTCVRCHKLDECQTCHGNNKIMGHPTDFLMAHMAEAKKPNPDCRVCHAQSFCAKCHPNGIDGNVFPK